MKHSSLNQRTYYKPTLKMNVLKGNKKKNKRIHRTFNLLRNIFDVLLLDYFFISVSRWSVILVRRCCAAGRFRSQIIKYATWFTVRPHHLDLLNVIASSIVLKTIVYKTVAVGTIGERMANDSIASLFK